MRFRLYDARKNWIPHHVMMRSSRVLVRHTRWWDGGVGNGLVNIYFGPSPFIWPYLPSSQTKPRPCHHQAISGPPAMRPDALLWIASVGFGSCDDSHPWRAATVHDR